MHARVVVVPTRPRGTRSATGAGDRTAGPGVGAGQMEPDAAGASESGSATAAAATIRRTFTPEA